MKKITSVIAAIIFVAFSVNLFADCDMMGMISTRGRYLSWEPEIDSVYNDPADMLTWLKERSNNETGYDAKPNPDGYGLLYYPEDGSFQYSVENNDLSNQAWYLSGYNQHYNHNEAGDSNNVAFDNAEAKINDNNTKASLVLGHARKGTGGFGSHPFRFEWEGKTYSFVHNGYTGDTIKAGMKSYLISKNWEFTSNWTESGYDYWIDSEILFHYIMAHVIEENGDVLRGIHQALNENDTIKDYISTSLNNIINFALSDGESIYLFRNVNDLNHSLQYKNIDNFGKSQFYAFRTAGNNNDFDGTELQNNHLMVLSPDGMYPPLGGWTYGYNVFANYFSPAFTTGNVEESVDKEHLIVTRDITVMPSAILNVGCMRFWGNHKVTVLGKLNIINKLELSNASEIEIRNDGVLNLTDGSTLSGKTRTIIGMADPRPIITGNEPSYLGDRIVARDGGLIKTDLAVNNRIVIKSESDELWDGIKIINSRHDQTFNFVNCDISGIRNFSISREGLGGIELVQGILNLKHTDFHNNGQLSVSDRQKLVITGDAENYCHFYDNQATPIYATEAAVELNYVWVGEENNLNYGGNNGAGIYLFDGDGYGSSISNSVFQGNNGIGVKLNNPNLKFINNQVIDNNSYGMLCYDGTVFYGHEGFKNITLSDNGSAEYASWQNTYRMANINANINITESNFGNGADNYSAMIIAWDGVRPVNVQGTNLTSNVLPHLFPSDANAWVFNRAPTRPETLLIDASNDIVEGNTAVATTTLKQIIAEYSTTDEAASAVYYLYHLNNCDENNFKSLRNYLETITPIIDTPLYKAQKSIIAKCYMKDEDYLSAINMLEEIIQDSQVNDDVIAAMIEQDYNYYKLSQINERSLPTSRSIETLQDYQDRVRELEAQFSFNQKVESNFLEQLPNEIITSNYPNPFNPTTTISYNLPADGNVEISIFNLKGQRVKRLQNDFRTAGNHSVVWDGCDERGNQTSSSVYFYRIKTAKLSTTKKILMMK